MIICCFSFNLFREFLFIWNNFEIWTIVWTEETLWRCQFGLNPDNQSVNGGESHQIDPQQKSSLVTVLYKIDKSNTRVNNNNDITDRMQGRETGFQHKLSVWQRALWDLLAKQKLGTHLELGWLCVCYIYSSCRNRGLEKNATHLMRLSWQQILPA